MSSPANQGYVITPMGYVGIRAITDGLTNATLATFKEQEWEPFEAWLCGAHPELIGVEMPPNEAGPKLFALFREYKRLVGNRARRRR